MKTIQVRWTRHAGHCWRSRDELISDVLLWTPTCGWAKAGQPARTYIQQLCEDMGCSPEDLPEVMNDREKWQERVRDIRTSGTTWWWWWWWWIYIVYIMFWNTKFTQYLGQRQGHVLAKIGRVGDQLIGLVGRVFANGSGDLGSIPGGVILKTLKMVLDTSLLNTQQYMVRIKGKVEQSREKSSTLPYTSV